MIKIYYIPNKAKLIERIVNCKGRVFLHLSEGLSCDLTKDTTALSILKMMDVGRDGLTLSFSNAEDIASFIQYLMEAGREEDTC